MAGLTLDPTRAYEGSSSLRAEVLSGELDGYAYGVVRQPGGIAAGERAFLGAAFWLPSTLSNAADLALLRLDDWTDDAGADQWQRQSVSLRRPAGASVWQLVARDDDLLTQTVLVSNVSLPEDAWTWVEVELLIGTSGFARVYVDGAAAGTEASGATLPSSTKPRFNRWCAGIAETGTAPQPTFQVNVDRVSVQTSLLGPSLTLATGLPSRLPESYGTVRYVGGSGASDSTGDGTSGKPWASISKAVTSCNAGDRIRLRSGNFGAPGLSRAFPIATPVTIEPDAGASPVIVGGPNVTGGSGIRLRSIVIDAAAATDGFYFGTNASDCELDMCEIKNAKARGIVASSTATRCHAWACRVHDCGWTTPSPGIWLDGPAGAAVNCAIYRCNGDGVRIGRKASGSVVSHCTADTNGGDGFAFYGDSSGVPSNAVVANSIASMNVGAGVAGRWGTGSPTPSGNRAIQVLTFTNGGGAQAGTGFSASGFVEGWPGYKDRAHDDFSLTGTSLVPIGAFLRPVALPSSFAGLAGIVVGVTAPPQGQVVTPNGSGSQLDALYQSAAWGSVFILNGTFPAQLMTDNPTKRGNYAGSPVVFRGPSGSDNRGADNASRISSITSPTYESGRGACGVTFSRLDIGGSGQWSRGHHLTFRAIRFDQALYLNGCEDAAFIGGEFGRVGGYPAGGNNHPEFQDNYYRAGGDTIYRCERLYFENILTHNWSRYDGPARGEPIVHINGLHLESGNDVQVRWCEFGQHNDVMQCFISSPQDMNGLTITDCNFAYGPTDLYGAGSGSTLLYVDNSANGPGHIRNVTIRRNHLPSGWSVYVNPGYAREGYDVQSSSETPNPYPGPTR